ncbi:hypothetical protein DRO21_06930 [archaeon]|nr:MAG: hypothetical protein DRO21_06930 [archaeon]
MKISATLLLLAFLLGMMVAVQPALAAEFHVTNATEFQNALDKAENNGEDDIIYLAAGTYKGNFEYIPLDTEHKSLTITNEPGVPATQIILDGQNNYTTLRLYDWSSGAEANIVINGITIQNGESPDNGGGIYAAMAYYNITITNCIVKNSTAKRYGGGIYVDTHKNITLENNQVYNNKTLGDPDRNLSRGGGVALITPFGNYTVRNNIIAWNQATGNVDNVEGGGLWVGWSSRNIIYLIGNTIYGNEALNGNGGGLYISFAETAYVYNNIVYANEASSGKDIYIHDEVTSRIAYNNDYSDVWGSWTEEGSNLNVDPQLVDPAGYDFHLKSTSPVIDKGTANVPDPPGLPSTDFEGDPRIIGAAPDIGADEASVTPPAVGGEVTPTIWTMITPITLLVVMLIVALLALLRKVFPVKP